MGGGGGIRGIVTLGVVNWFHVVDLLPVSF